MSSPSAPELQHLLDLPIFAGVPEVDLREMLEVAEIRPLAADEVLMEAGDPGDELAVVLSGGFTVELGAGDEVLPLAWVSAGEVLGETALYRREARRSARVRATEPATVLLLEASDFEALALRRNRVPQAIEEAVLRTLAGRVHDSLEAIDGVLSSNRAQGAEERSLLGRLRELLRR